MTMRKKFDFTAFIKIFAIGFTAIFLVSLVLSNVWKYDALAADDSTAPIVTKVKVLTPSINGLSGTIKISMDVIEEETGVKSVTAQFQHKIGGTTNLMDVCYEYETGQTTGTITFYSNNMAPNSGEFYLSEIVIEDFAGNRRVYNSGKPLSDSYADLRLSDDNGYYIKDCSNSENHCYFDGDGIVTFLTSDGALLPKVAELNIKGDNVDKGGKLNFEMTLEEEEKITLIHFALYNEDQGCTEDITLTPDQGDFSVSGKKISGTMKIPSNMPAGLYSIFTLQIDSSSQSNTYWSGESEDVISNGSMKCYLTGAKKFRVNSDGDDDAPHITDIKVLSGTVKKPGVVKVQISAEDNTSIKSIEIMAERVNETGNRSFYIEKQYASPVSKWTKIFSVPISTSATNGQYVISFLRVKDSSGNTREYGSLLTNTDADGAEYRTVFQDDEGYYMQGPDDERVHYTGDPFIVVENEFDVAFNVGLSNKNLLTYINNMEESYAGKIRIEGSRKANASIFRAIKGKDKTLIFYNSNYQWVFNGKDIVKPKTIDLGISFKAEEGADYSTEGKVLNIEFADNGELPGIANIRIKSDYTRRIYNLENDLYLYYCNSKKNQLELEEDSEINYFLDDSDNWCSFYITHNSRYITAGKKLKNTGLPQKRGTKIKVKGNIYKVLGKKQVEFVKPATKNIKKLIIPKTVKYKNVTYTVTRIASRACYGCKKLKSVTIGDNVEKIGSKAFYNTKKLSVMVIKTQKLTSKVVGSQAFKGVTSNAKIKVPKKMLKKYKKLLRDKGISKRARIKC
ncbi:MAG: leucine-rich repeat protein [Lachnospiraceae bacterium]